MEDIEIGNDIAIKWAIYVENTTDPETPTPYDLTGRDLSLYVEIGSIRTRIRDFIVTENELRFTFYGMYQTTEGVHRLTLIENDGQKNMHTVRECKAFRLVSYSCEVGDGKPEENLEVVSLQFRTTMMLGGGLGNIDAEMSDKSENAVQNKVIKAYVDEQVSDLASKADLKLKEDKIEDLATIRSNAAKGATALQSIPSEYVTETELAAKGYATKSALTDKVDKVSGKQLSTEDFTSALKAKLEGLSNYDDTALSNAISALETRLNTLVGGDASTAIDSFNEIMAFLDGIKDTQDLGSIIASIEQQIAAKQDKITDLETIRSGAAKGATALQEHQDISHLATKKYVDDAVAKAGGGGVDPELLEGYIPMSREFSDDFNNDFTR